MAARFQCEAVSRRVGVKCGRQSVGECSLRLPAGAMRGSNFGGTPPGTRTLNPRIKRDVWSVRGRPSVEANAIRAVLTSPPPCALVEALGYRNGYTGRAPRCAAAGYGRARPRRAPAET